MEQVTYSFYTEEEFYSQRPDWFQELDNEHCPKCHSADLISISGNFPTGVVAPDGYQETWWQEGWECNKCGLKFDKEVDDERLN
jgi:hypothetical protein